MDSKTMKTERVLKKNITLHSKMYVKSVCIETTRILTYYDWSNNTGVGLTPSVSEYSPLSIHASDS